MSKQRVCDLDGTVVYAADLFYTVTDSRTGRSLDICLQCARSNAGAPLWTANATRAVGDRVRRTAGSMGKNVWQCTVAGTTGAAEPAWPTAAGSTVVDGTVTWQTVLAPNNLTTIKIKLPGVAAVDTSLYGWVSGTNEPA